MATIDELKVWLRAMSDRGVYGSAAARVRATAVEQLTTVLGEGEPKDPAWLLENIDAVTNRWATKNHANPDTANTYKSRAKSTLAEFLDYVEDPSRFRGPRSRRAQRTTQQRTKTTAPVGAEQQGRDAEIPPASSLVTDSSRAQSFVFALSSGSGRLTVPFPLTLLDIRIIKKQIELLELQVEMGRTE